MRAALRTGESVRSIARHQQSPLHHVQRYLSQNGGVRPSPRRRAVGHLTAAEREEVSRGLAAGESCRRMAARLGRSPATIGREIARNGGRDRYRAQAADEAAFDRARRPKPSLLARSDDAPFPRGIDHWVHRLRFGCMRAALDLPARETRDRVRAGILNSGLPRPSAQLTISLVPAAVPRLGHWVPQPIWPSRRHPCCQLGHGHHWHDVRQRHH